MLPWALEYTTTLTHPSHGLVRLSCKRELPHTRGTYTRQHLHTHLGGTGVPTWLVQALHRYTQVPSPTLSTLRDDQSTRFR